MAGDLVVPAAIRALRRLVEKGVAAVRDRLPQAGHDLASLEPALARNTQRLQQPAAQLRQRQAASKSHQISSNFTRYFTTASKNTKSAQHAPVRSAVGRITKTSPFASALRPKLCGALPRSQGGYSLGGSARYFSHQTAPAQVIAQVSQAMRAFILSGKDMSYYAAKRRNDRTYIKGQIQLHLLAASTDRLAPGAYIDFHISPTLTCLSATDPVGYTCLDNTRGGFMEELDVDLNQAIRDISIVYQDLRRLSSLGELPISLVSSNTLRVHFRGCTADLVTNLCDEVGVFSGVIHEDERFAYDKLLPAESSANGVNWKEMLSSESELEATDWEFERYSISSHDDGNIYNENLDQYSNEIESPHWEDSAEELYDEIEPGGYSSEEHDGSEVDCGKNKMGVYIKENGGFVNPWVMPAPDRAGTF